MPARDGTGPQGMGPMTGWGRGNCIGSPVSGSRRFSGFGGGFGRWARGWGRGFGRKFWGIGPNAAYPQIPLNAQDEAAALREEARQMEQEVQAMRRRIEELESGSGEQK